MIDAIDFFVPWDRYDDDRASDYRVEVDWLSAIKKEHRIGTRWRRNGFWVHVSLPRLIRDNNRVGVDSGLVPVSITRLKEVLETDPSLCQVRRIEVGATFRVKHHPSQYLSEWVRLSQIARDTMNYGQTVYFKNKVWSIYGYDKDAEEGVEHDNNFYSLRIEYRRMKQLARLFHGEPLTVQDLARPEFVGKLATTWAEKYFKIVKSTSGAELKIPRTPAMLRGELATHGLRSCGTEKTLASIACAARTKDIDQKTATRMRSLVADLCRPTPRNPSSLSSEVDLLVLERAREAGGAVEELIAAYGLGSSDRRCGS
jgi:hypothetical protein